MKTASKIGAVLVAHQLEFEPRVLDFEASKPEPAPHVGDPPRVGVRRNSFLDSVMLPFDNPSLAGVRSDSTAR